MINVIFKCDTCGYLAEGNGNDIEKAKIHTFQMNHLNGSKGCNGIFRFYTIVNKVSDKYNEKKLEKIKNSTCTFGDKDCIYKPCLQSPEMLAICQFESYEYRLRSGSYNISSVTGVQQEEVFEGIPEQLDKIAKSTCTNCPYKDKCKKSPGMLALCQVESLDYRLRSGKYSISGAGIGELSGDINSVTINDTLVCIEDIKRLVVARPDTFSLYPKNYTGKEDVPETFEPPTDDVILRALMGGITIGFRPVDPKTGLYKWIVYDIDKKHCIGTIYESNPRLAVDKIVKLLKDWYNLTGYIELSGSPDSYHIWVFIEPTDKEIVYKFDKDFKERCDPFINQAIDCRVQTGDGRMIKMPYAINLKNGVRGKFIAGVDLHTIQPEKLPRL